MSHGDLPECDMWFRKMTTTAAPGAGSQETEAFEWVMGRMQRMILSRSIVVVDMRL